MKINFKLSLTILFVFLLKFAFYFKNSKQKVMKKVFLPLLVVGLAFTSCKEETTTPTPEVTEVEVTETETTPEVVFTPDYKIDASSVINWVGSKPAGKHEGTITLKEGGFTVVDGAVTGGEFVIDMNSITVTDLEGDKKAGLEGHLKGTGEEDKADHFFNVNQFPTGKFTIKSIVDGTVTGDLTLKGKTNEISFPATISVTDTDIAFETENFQIDRTKWGVNYSSKSVFDDLKDKFINDEIDLTINIKALK